MRRRVINSLLALLTSTTIATTPMLANAAVPPPGSEPAPAPAPAVAPPVEAAPAPAPALAPAPAPALAATGPVVYLINEKPDESRGPLKLARYRGSTAQAAGNTVVVTTLYDEICTEPCGVQVDATDNPRFFIIRDEKPVSYAFRLNRQGEITLSIKPGRAGLQFGGVILLSFLILPAGIPMLIAGASKVYIADGPPSEGQVFAKLKKAKS
jgi:hypothetical protein